MSRKNLAVQLDGVDSTRAPTVVRHKLSCILRGYRDCGQLPLISLALIAVSQRVGGPRTTIPRTAGKLLCTGREAPGHFGLRLVTGALGAWLWGLVLHSVVGYSS